jgi:hypothetical protein
MFGPFFKGESFTAWRAFLSAMFAEPMSGEELAIYRQCTGRQEPPAEPVKEGTLVIGRRGGKSRTLALIATHLATSRDYSPYLAPGEVGTVAVIASDRKQARAIFRYVQGMLHAVPDLAALILEETQDSITLSNGPAGAAKVAIEIQTASFRVTRGYTFVAVLCDETAFWRDENSANPDVEIFRALRPGMATIPGAMLLNASSPYRKSGVLWRAFQRYYGKDVARRLVWKAPTRVMNPTIDPAEEAEAYEDDAASASAEWGGEFRDDIGEFVPRAVVEACTAPGRFELPYVPGQHYVAFVDPSGGSSDSMTLAIAHADPKERTRAVLAVVREKKAPFSPDAVVSEFVELLKAYRVAKVKGDRYAGEFAREPFRLKGVAYEISEKPKGDIYRETLPLLNSGRVELLDIPVLTNQLCNLERRTARGGRDSIDHPPGAHDDVANAVAGALLEAVGGPAPMKITAGLLAALSQPGPDARHWQTGVGK